MLTWLWLNGVETWKCAERYSPRDAEMLAWVLAESNARKDVGIQSPWS